MKGSSSDGTPSLEEVGLRAVFINMNEEFRAEVVRRALAGRERVSDRVRVSLNQAIDSLGPVSGYRVASKAPYTFLQDPVKALVRSNDRLAGAVLRVWAELDRPLSNSVRDYLKQESLLEDSADYSQNKILAGRLGDGWDAAMDGLAELHPDISKDDLLLMGYYVSGRMPDGAGEVADTPTPPANELPDVFQQVLDTLRTWPASAPQWEQVASDFTDIINEIRQDKQREVQALTEVDTRLGEVLSRHDALLAFFEWDPQERLPERPCPWADLKAARQAIGDLDQALSEYASVHPMAAVLSEEDARAPRRAELQKQVKEALAKVESLEVQTPVDAPPAEEPAMEEAANPPPLPAQTQEQQAEFDMLRADLDARIESLTGENQSLTADNQRLSEDNRSLNAEVHVLRDQVGELEGDMAESSFLAESWRRLYHDSQKPQGETASPLPELKSVEEAVQLARQKLGGRLQFQLNHKSDTEIPFKPPRQVWDALEWLATTYYQAKTGERPEADLDGSLRRAVGWHYTPFQSPVTMGQFKEDYEVWVSGRKHELREHIGTGNGYPQGTIRIAFHWHTDLRKVVVGFIGRHQRTVAS